jgi:methionine--tRNA ligase beta chain|eukprot:Transcript_6978.p1 GENE.Transcript_6978~~Transcript_6978.p1  ORF type:complete len:273 (-),score=79.23 Transcript_6978:79-897(-)
MTSGRLRRCFALACTLSGGSALTVRPLLRPAVAGTPRQALRMMCDAPAAEMEALKTHVLAVAKDTPAFAEWLAAGGWKAGAAPAAPAAAAASPAKKATKAPPAASDVPPFALLDVRVGKIVEAWPHPDSDKLWCERIDVGEDAPREIASGLRAYYPEKEELEGRSVIVVCNLKAAKLAGFASNGMVLCASSEDKSTVKFVEPPADAKPGERVTAEGMVEEPAGANAVKKKKLMEGAAAELRAVDGVACYRNVPLSVAAGQCTTGGVAAGTIN